MQDELVFVPFTASAARAATSRLVTAEWTINSAKGRPAGSRWVFQRQKMNISHQCQRGYPRSCLPFAYPADPSLFDLDRLLSFVFHNKPCTCLRTNGKESERG